MITFFGLLFITKHSKKQCCIYLIKNKSTSTYNANDDNDAGADNDDGDDDYDNDDDNNILIILESITYNKNNNFNNEDNKCNSLRNKDSNKNTPPRRKNMLRKVAHHAMEGLAASSSPFYAKYADCDVDDVPQISGC